MMPENPGQTPAGQLQKGSYNPWAPKRIKHAILTILPRKDGEPIAFGVGFPEKQPDHTRIEEYASAVATGHGMLRDTLSYAESPWDIEVEEQCYLLLELDLGIPNWQFYGHALTSKGSKEGHDSDLHWVAPDGAVRQGKIPKDFRGVQVIYFSVGQRAKGGHHKYNLLVEFLDLSKPGSKLPTIFDPDVPNSGEEFP